MEMFSQETYQKNKIDVPPEYTIAGWPAWYPPGTGGVEDYDQHASRELPQRIRYAWSADRA